MVRLCVVVVDELPDWHGVPIFLGRGKTHRITYADIRRDLAPLNEGRDGGVPPSPTTASGSTAKRHYEPRRDSRPTGEP